MRSVSTALLMALVAGLCAPEAHALQTPGGTRATGTREGFEVFGTSRGSLAFCAAGHFARRKLNARAADRVVLARPYGPSPTQSNQRSVGFVLVPQGGGGGDSFIMQTGKRGVGQSRNVTHAIAQCPTR